MMQEHGLDNLVVEPNDQHRFYTKYDIKGLMSLKVKMPSGGMQVIQACHKVVKHVLAVADPTWYAAVKAAKMAAQMDDVLLHYDDIELDKLGVSEDSPLSTSDAMPRNGRLGILKEEAAQWIDSSACERYGGLRPFRRWGRRASD
eukprot:jgi/Mesvir1/17708/Mv19667-RA.1